MNNTLIAQVTNTAGQMAQAAAKKPAADAQATDAKAADGKTAAGEKAAAETASAPASAPEAATAAKTESHWYKAGAMGLMLDGGIFMWPILALAVVAAGVTIERLRSLKMIGADTTQLRRKVLELLQADRGEEALELCLSQQGPVPAVLTAGIRKYLVLKKLNYDPARIEEQVVKAMEDYGVHIVAALEKHLPILATISTVAPMVGSVGTVVGMVILFKDIVAQMGTVNIILAAAAGIQVKLLVTVWGLIVGIPAYVAFNYFTTIINQYVLNVEESATELMEAVTLQMAVVEKSAPGAANSADRPHAEQVNVAPVA